MHLCSTLRNAQIKNAKFPQSTLDKPRRWVVTDSGMATMPGVFFGHEESPATRIDGLSPGGLATPQVGEVCRILVFNGTGTGYGDLLCGSVAIRLLHEGIVKAGGIPRIEIIYAPDHAKQYEEVYGGNPHIAQLIPAAIAAEEIGRSHFYVSTERLLVDPKFDELDMIDYFIWRFGMDPAQYSAEEKLPAIPYTAETARGEKAAFDLRAKGEKICLLNFHASGFRRVSVTIWRALAEAVADAGYRIWFTGAPHRGKEVIDAFRVLKFHEIGALDVLPITQTWHDLCGVIRGVDAVITPDTSVLHIAGACKIPCVGLMFSIEPKLRISYYPTVRGYVRPEWKKAVWWGKSRMDALKEPLEQNEDWRKAWELTNPAGVAKLLEKIVNGGK